MANQRQMAASRPAKSTTMLPLWQKLLLGLLCLPLAGLLLPSLCVLAFGMAPTFSAFVADREPRRFLTLTVALPNALGCLPALIKLWSLGQGFAAAKQVLADPFGWAVAFGAAGLGWLIYLSMPPLIAVYYGVASGARRKTLEALQKNLVETWGEEVAAEAGEEADGPARRGGGAG